MLSPAEEMRFWTAIMRDHGEFLITGLSSREQDFIWNAYFFRNSFAALHEEVKKYMDSPDLTCVINLANNCVPLLVNFINFKKIILTKLLKCNIEIVFPPTFINHMINEAMEFYRTLCIIQTNVPVNTYMENLRLHIIWLPDAAGHAASIASNLDPVEKVLINKAQKFEKCFNCLFIKAYELEKMLERACLENGTLEQLNEEVEEKMQEFVCFLEKVLKLREECRVMGTIKPLIPYHMIREENYYLAQIKSLQSK